MEPQSMKTCVFFADRHLIHDEPAHWSWELFKEFLYDFKPDILVDGGDHVDFPYISSFNKDKLLLLEGKRLKKDFDLLNEELADLRQTCDRMLFLQGNHEERLERAVQKQPLLEGMVDLEANVDFKALDIEYYPLKQQPVKIDKLHFLHGTYTGVNHTKKQLIKYMGSSLIYGHVHAFQAYSVGVPLRNDEWGSWSVGCLCSKTPEWMKGPAHWQNGFAVIYFDDNGNFNVYPVIMTKKRFIYGGKVYE